MSALLLDKFLAKALVVILYQLISVLWQVMCASYLQMYSWHTVCTVYWF